MNAPKRDEPMRCLHPLDYRRDNGGNRNINGIYCDKCGADVTEPFAPKRDERPEPVVMTRRECPGCAQEELRCDCPYRGGAVEVQYVHRENYLRLAAKLAESEREREREYHDGYNAAADEQPVPPVLPADKYSELYAEPHAHYDICVFANGGSHSYPHPGHGKIPSFGNVDKAGRDEAAESALAIQKADWNKMYDEREAAERERDKFERDAVLFVGRLAEAKVTIARLTRELDEAKANRCQGCLSSDFCPEHDK